MLICLGQKIKFLVSDYPTSPYTLLGLTGKLSLLFDIFKDFYTFFIQKSFYVNKSLPT